MASITYESAQRRYPGTPQPAVDSLDLQIEDGEFIVLVGPSGCGKSTSLRMLAGLEPVDSGRIMIGERDVTGAAPKDRDIAMVFQNYALYPHMSVADNMAFSLKMARMPKPERRERVLQAARLLDLEPYLDRKPKALSGGQRQRVAMGRAIVRQPQVFCMDEPLSNLDAQLRVSTRTQIAALQQRLGVTTVYVTHDQTEAMTMGDRVAVMSEGRLQQVDTPLALYDRPANLFVAGFIGSPGMNLLPATLTSEGALVDGLVVPLAPEVRSRLNGAPVLGIRPEKWRQAESGVEVEIAAVEELGAESFLYGTSIAADGQESVVVVRTPTRQRVERGAKIYVEVDPRDVHVFDQESGARL